jgi:hypothetical protein
LLEFPWPRLKPEGLARQAADGTDVDNISGEDIGDGTIAEGSDVVSVPALKDGHQMLARDFIHEPHAARAHDASVAFNVDQSVELRFEESAPFVLHAAVAEAVFHAVALEHTFTAPVANRAIERMLNEKEFHHSLAAILDERAFGFNLEPLGAGHVAGDIGTRLALDFDETEPAVSGNREGGMPAVMGDVVPGLEQRREKIFPFRQLHFGAVDRNGNKIGGGF